MKTKKGLNKKPLSINCDEISEMEASVYSEFTAEGVRFLKYDIVISKEGLTNFSGDTYANLPPMSKSDLITTGNILGRGAACLVHDGIYKPLGIRVAIKTINAYDREKRHQIMKDIKILLSNIMKAEKSGYSCQFLVNLYGAYYEEGSVKVILELMDAGSLEGILKVYRTKKIAPRIPQEILAKIAIQVLCGLSYLHSNNLLHRDIKPGNILVNSKGQVKLTDFGISKELDFIQQMSRTSVGTITYMSPERILGKPYNAKSDVWSFGIVMYELATGRYPYESTTSYIELAQIMENSSEPELPMDSVYSQDLREFIGCLLRKNPQERASSAELLGDRWILTNIMKEGSVKQWLSYFRDNVLSEETP